MECNERTIDKENIYRLCVTSSHSGSTIECDIFKMPVDYCTGRAKLKYVSKQEIAVDGRYVLSNF